MTVPEALQNSTIFAYLLPLVSAILLTQLLMPAVVRLARGLNAVDHPNERKVHRQATPRMGGVAFLAALLLVPFSFVDVSISAYGFLLGLIIIGATGVADDIVELSPRIKFAGIIAGSTIFLLLSGTAITNLGDLVGLGNIETGWLAIPITLVAMVGFVNAINLSDGLDGLAAGIGLIATFFIVCFAYAIGDHFSLILALVLFGSMIGFLYFNAYPARIFMGDTGSLVLGYTLAALSLMLLKSAHGHLVSPVTMGLLLGLPLADTLYVMMQRIAKGKSPFLPDKTHFHHRLIHLEMSHHGAVALFYGLIFFYGCIAVLMAGQAVWLQMLALLALILMTYLPLVYLERIQFSFHAFMDTGREAGANKPFFSKMTHFLGLSIPFMTWLIPASLVVPVCVISPSFELLLWMAAVIVMVLLLYPWYGHHDDSWSQGLIYLLVFTLLLAINMAPDAWIQSYLQAVAALLTAWVVLKLWFKRHRRIFLTTGLEILLLIISWLVPWIVGSFGLLPTENQQLLYVVCAQSVIFLLAMKIIMRRQPRRNRPLLFSLLLLVGVALL